MKKNFRKLVSLALALLLVSALSITAFAADIGEEKAKQIALENAGYSASDTEYLVARPDFDDGVRYYDISFAIKNADGSFTEYDYDVATDGRILEKDIDKEYVPGAAKPAAPAAQGDIGKDAAAKAAIAYFGLEESAVKLIQLKKSYEDGVQVYEVEFCEPYEVKYSCDVVASSGAVVDVDKDFARGFIDKLELFFEVIFYRLFAR